MIDRRLEGVNAVSEARGLLQLLRGGDTVESLRNLIGNSPERQKVLLAFDLLAQQVPKRPEKMRAVRLRANSNGSPAGPALRAEILRLLSLNLSQMKVCARLRLGRSVVESVAREAGAAYRKLGRGRRFHPQVLGQIRDAVRAGELAVSICQRFRCSRDVIVKIRKQFKDFEDRRFRRNYDLKAVKQALAAGKSLGEIEGTLGIAHACLWKLRRRSGDMEDRRHRNRRIFSDIERAEILADIRAGMTQRAIGKKFHTHTDHVRAIETEAGFSRTHREFTANEVARINDEFGAGKRNGEIAKAIGCTSGAIWQRRKMFQREQGGDGL